PLGPAPETTPVQYANGFAGTRPNPFRQNTVISFSVAHASPVHLVVYDITGRRGRTLVDGVLDAGMHEGSWGGEDHGGRVMASGIYFVRLSIGDWCQTRRTLCSR